MQLCMMRDREGERWRKALFDDKKKENYYALSQLAQTISINTFHVIDHKLYVTHFWNFFDNS